MQRDGAVEWCNDVLQPRWWYDNIAKVMQARSAHYINKTILVLLKYNKAWPKMFTKWWLVRSISYYLVHLSIESFVR